MVEAQDQKRNTAPIAVKLSKKEQDFMGLKQLAINLDSSVDILPNAISADGSEARGLRHCGSLCSAKDLGKNRTEQSLLNLVNKI